MIEFEEVTKRFSSPPAPGRPPRVVEAVRQVTLGIPGGGVWAVVGPNGAGKSTLFALLLGFLHPSEGRLRIRGLEPRRYVRRHGAAYLPERFQLPGEWRVGAALQALARLEGFRGAEARRRAGELIDRFALTEHAGKPVRALSRGLLQRLGLAQALLAERELVVLDEPMAGLDPLWRIRFRTLVEELRSQGRTILIASHELAEVERIADRVVLLDEGRVRDVMDLSQPAGAAQQYRIELAEPTPALDEAFPGAVAINDAEPPAYLVSVPDPRELSQRLAALLTAGGILVSVQPAAEPLEERVRRALGHGGKT
ncbi:MAG TPA: ABC transporter ATP-binding protein [Longimicrobiales bacterium]|jgi:ABC-2 type transport system ATP-binding protein